MEGGRELEAVADGSIHAGMGDRDGAEDLDRRAARGEADREQAEPEGPVVDEVVGERPEARITQIADRREIREQQQRDHQQPWPAEPAVGRQALRRRPPHPPAATSHGRSRSAWPPGPWFRASSSWCFAPIPDPIPTGGRLSWLHCIALTANVNSLYSAHEPSPVAHLGRRDRRGGQAHPRDRWPGSRHDAGRRRGRRCPGSVSLQACPGSSRARSRAVADGVVADLAGHAGAGDRNE